MEYRVLEKFPDYRIYPDGTVISLKRKVPKEMRHSINSNGYYVINIRNKFGKTEYKGVHTLVAEAFIPNPDNKPHVNHKDRNPKNPHVSNLEWVTHKENMRHSSKARYQLFVEKYD